MHYLRLLPVFFFLLLFASAGWSQPLEVTDGATAPYTPENLISNIFLGEGVEVLSVEYFGVPTAVGYFNNAEDEIGINRGVIMTSGAVAQSPTFVGVDNVGSAFASSPNGATAANNDPDLQAISTATVFDAAKYVITFIPTSDTLRFNYVWASEEYPEWACSSFNDVFGFFLSGPGINGPYENNGINIALIPGTNLPVAINNLHPANGANCPPENEQFYVSNNNSSNQPVYDGFTTVLTAEAIVTPCEVYTIKLVIADNGDGVFDSGVFLEAKSFGTGSLDVEVVTTSVDGAVTEGCSEATLVFSLPTPAAENVPIDFSLFGDAVNGVDYDFIDDSNLMIPAGDSMVSVVIHAVEDGLTEGDEAIYVDVQRDVCNRDTFVLYIKDRQLIPPELGPDTTLCLLEPVQLDGTVNIPLPPPPTFTNSTPFLIDPPETEIYSPVTVGGVVPEELGPNVIQSVCINVEHAWLDDLDIYLLAPNGLFMELSTDNGSNGDDYTQTCFTPDAITPIDYVMPPASGAPYTGDFLPEGYWEDLWSGQENPTNGTWQLLIIDDQNGFEGTLLDWTITFEPAYQVYYEWTPSVGLSCDDCPNPIATPPDTTTYYLHVYDSYGCEEFDTITINTLDILPAPAVSCSVSNDTCITYTWTPVAGALTYEVSLDGGMSWITPDSPFSHTACVGFETEFTLLVRGVLDCGGHPGEATCTTPPCSGGIPQIVNVQNPLCYGDSNGSIAVTAAGSFPPFFYVLGTDTTTTGLFENLPAGDHTIYVVNQVGCAIDTTVSLEQPWILSGNIHLVNPVSCAGGSNGTLSVVPTGGTAPYTYSWSNGQTDSIATDLPPGLVEVTITDANGCQAFDDFVLSDAPPMFVTTSSTVVACSGDSTGTAVVFASGGVPDYAYLWSTGDTTSFVVDLPAGLYTVTVADANGCEVVDTAVITENPPLVLTTDYTPASCNGGNDGTATVMVSGGWGTTYFYLWDAAAGNQLTATAVNLSAGTYSVTVSDLQGCLADTTVVVDEASGMDIQLQLQDASCSDAADGVALLTVSGGTPGYNFSWSDGGPDVPGRTDLPQGSYQVTVQDAAGCEKVLDFTIGAPPALSLSLNATPALCSNSSDGTATAEVSGGVPPYSYLWSDGQTTQTAVNLPQGSYQLTVTDANGCDAEGEVEVASSDTLLLSLNATPTLCHGSSDGTATVMASGGTPPYTYQWSNGQNTETAFGLSANTYSVVVTDANGCMATENIEVDEPPLLEVSVSELPVSCDGTSDGSATAMPTGGTPDYTYLWSDGQTTQTAVNLPEGSYQLTVTDAHGCMVLAEANITSPPPLIVHLESSEVSCFEGSDGSLTVVMDSGTPPLTYHWSTGANTQTISGLAAGVYSVTVMDQSNCETIVEGEVTQPGQLAANLVQTAASCFNGLDGTATVSAVFYGSMQADLMGFDFMWSTTPPQTGATAFGLQGGATYTVLITDAQGCTLEESITIGNPLPVEVFVESVEHVSCAGGADGSATVYANGGQAPYNYLWSANTGGQTEATAVNLPAGTYQVTITDAEGCLGVTQVEVNEPAPLQLASSAQRVACYGEASGAVEVEVTGGVPPYAYVWSNGEEGAAQGNLEAGWYQVTVMDANGCEEVDSVEVRQPDAPLYAEAQPVDPSCYGRQDGSIEISVQGGTPPYSFSMDEGASFTGSAHLQGLVAGTYYVLVKDDRNCLFQIGPLVLENPPEIQLDLGSDTVLGYLDQIQLSAEVQHGQQPYSYQWWVSGSGTLDCYDCPAPLTGPMEHATTFWLEVTDAKGCSQTDKILVYVRRNNVLLVPTAFTPNGDGQNDLLLVHGTEGAIVRLFRVFDRWGEVLYEASGFPVNDPHTGWDGRFRGQLMDTGVYTWYVEVVFPGGEVVTYKGHTSLLR